MSTARTTRNTECMTCGLGFLQATPPSCEGHALVEVITYADCLSCQSTLTHEEQATELVERERIGFRTRGRFCGTCRAANDVLAKQASHASLAAVRFLPPAVLGQALRARVHASIDAFSDEELGEFMHAIVSADLTQIGRLAPLVMQRMKDSFN